MTLRISASESSPLACFAVSRIALTRLGDGAMPRCSNQKMTFDSPLIGPISITCSQPKSSAGTPE